MPQIRLRTKGGCCYCISVMLSEHVFRLDQGYNLGYTLVHESGHFFGCELYPSHQSHVCLICRRVHASQILYF